jgi:hypothetical protein
MAGDSTVFGVNFVDGRIKGYPKYMPGSNNTNPNIMYFRMVRGRTDYGINNYVDNNDGTITDNATCLMWQQADDSIARDWEHSLAYAENLNLAEYTDWRLPNAKELQSIVDYTRCPDVTNSPAIDPLFSTTMINDPNGNPGQYPYFWTSTTHLDGINPYSPAVYVAFGEAQGRMNGTLMDVHGAGAQRSDPKTGNPDDYPTYMGPQGDVRYVFNYTRCVRDITPTSNHEDTAPMKSFNLYPNPVKSLCSITLDKSYHNINISVYNIRGMRVFQKKAQDLANTEINLSDLPSGVYLAKVIADGFTASRKVVKIK